MFECGDGNLSDSSDVPSQISNRSEPLNGREHLLNPNLNLSISSNSSVEEDPKTQEIRCLREENCRLKRRLQDILGDSEDDVVHYCTLSMTECRVGTPYMRRNFIDGPPKASVDQSGPSFLQKLHIGYVPGPQNFFRDPSTYF